MVGRYGPHNPDETYVAARAIPSSCSTPARCKLNYATAGDASKPALLLVPGQTESWWGYEAAMDLLKDRFQIFAVDLRGQGRSGRTPGRYTLDNMGNDLVRLIQGVIGRPAHRQRPVVRRGAVGLALGLRAAGPGPRRALRGPAAVRLGDHTRRTATRSSQSIGPMFAMWSKYLGDQWSVGNWAGMVANAAQRAAAVDGRHSAGRGAAAEPEGVRSRSGAARSGPERSPPAATTRGC